MTISPKESVSLQSMEIAEKLHDAYVLYSSLIQDDVPEWRDLVSTERELLTKVAEELLLRGFIVAGPRLPIIASRR